ncbi:MAG TPA: acyl-CoA dehydrogenase family protein [Spirochaetota bacterium]|nr:acyl-CoA dehydrogenase family protein [Spirochaetota bacterium]HOD16495.1 acyl-CoA dehydrogenase family protein [Spirochaetota bacterium]HPG49346.1 acyl-CoA dehydrogenase family protein [Spirochaetota bacterium]HPN14178.1 acyl-CoA dehydrogenase family protein [Spirochaetota bacterium]
MNLHLTEEQIMIRDMIREFARSEIEPVAQYYNERGEYPGAIIKKLGGLGLFGMMVPEQYGGSGAGAVSYSLALQEIAYSCASVAVTLSVTNLVTGPILEYGDEDQKKGFLRPLAAGEHVGAFALTEPGAGSDPSSLTTAAVKKGKSYVLNGTKQFITNGKHAGVFVVIARTSKEKNGLSAFLVPAGAKGLSVGKEERKMGLRASDTVEIVLDECEVPAANMLGRPGMGLTIALDALDSGRIGIASQATGMIAACLHEGVLYAGERRQFGKAIIRHQAIQHMIADIAVDYDAAALLTWSAASLKDAKASFTREASIAKLYATEALNRCAYRALQIFGGYGYIRDNKVERLYRDARVTTIYEGTSEVQRMVIARETERNS